MTFVPVIDESACSAHGDCEQLAPNVFELRHLAVVIGTGTQQQLLTAAEGCPASAISLIDDDTGVQVYP
jgi:ferredoxin